jgi:hypothetical protein
VTDAPPHSGDKYAACFNAVLPDINDDWMFTPQLSSSVFDELSFWARSYTDDYNLDRFEVGVSTTDTNPSSFAIISTGPYIEAPIEWTEYTYDLSSYSGDIYIGIHCVSNDAFFLMIDDFSVTGTDVQPAIPNLDCYGTLSWTNVTAGETVTGEFTVENIGDEDSLLDWEIESYPDWGNWTFDPENGTGLEEGNTVTIDVEVVAPEDPETEFTGEVKIVNSDNASDFCIIDVTLATPVSQQSLISLFFEMLAQRFPILGMILAALF